MPVTVDPSSNTNGAVKPGAKAKSKNQFRRAKNKAKKEQQNGDALTSKVKFEEGSDRGMDVDGQSDVEYVSETIDVKAPGLEAFSDVFARFQADESATDIKEDKPTKGDVIYSDEEMPSDDEASDTEKKTMSKRKQKKMARLSVAELKQLVKKPEVVEWTDVSAADPRMLLHLKSYRNTIPIPAHWSAKRDYLQGKRGIEKPPFQLPAYIADTGIATMRDAVKEKEANMSLKAKTRERVQPKMGKVDIDYQKLHDAFFKFQTKPPLTGYGEMYYEGKEFETSLKEKRPGDLSPELIRPPPSYPTLKIPGLNAPIPEGAQWGFHPGGWGKPPLDEYNRPLYGDVFGVLTKPEAEETEPIDRSLWGELEPEEEDSESEEESEEEEEMEQDEDAEAAPAADGLQTPSGLETPSGLTSVVSTVPGGIETPDFLELRKRDSGAVEAAPSGPKQLYQVVPERQTNVRGLMGSERGYDLGSIGASGAGVPVLGEERSSKRRDGVDVSIDASELEGLTQDQIRAKYDAISRGNAGVPGSANKEDFSDLISKETAKRKAKAEATKGKGKEKEFKF